MRYTRDSLHYEKKKLCLFWMAEAKAPLVSLTLLFSSSFSTTWFKLNKRILYAFVSFWIYCFLLQSKYSFKKKVNLFFFCPFGCTWLSNSEKKNIFVEVSTAIMLCWNLNYFNPMTLSLWALFQWDFWVLLCSRWFLLIREAFLFIYLKETLLFTSTAIHRWGIHPSSTGLSVFCKDCWQR